MISVNFYIIFTVFYFILFCSVPLSSMVSGATQIHFVIVNEDRREPAVKSISEFGS